MAKINRKSRKGCEKKKIVICNWERAKTKTKISWVTEFKLANYAEMVRFVALMERFIRNRKETESNRVTGAI